MNSVFFSLISVQPLTVLVDCWFKIEESPNKMSISWSEFQQQIILSHKTDRIRASVLNIWSHSFLLCLLISSSLSLMHSCTVPLGSTAASLEFLHSLSLYAFCLRHNSKSVLSSCGCSLALTLTISIGIWHSAGVTKSWLHPATLKKSFALIKNSLEATEILYLDDERNAQRWQWNTNWRHVKIYPYDWKVRREYPWM